MAEQKQGSTRTLPKNIRQIGTSSGTSRVYLEDYVYTYLHAQEELDAWTYRGFVLLGKIERGKDFARYFISGLIRVEDEFFKDCMLEFGDETWAYIYKEMKQYYEDLEIVGWGQDVSNASAGLAAEIERNHKQNFNIHKNVLFLLNLAEQEEAFYVFEKNMLQRKEGYYVYYEKNPQMQDYMIESRKNPAELQIAPEEIGEPLVHSYREALLEKKAQMSARKWNGVLYTTSMMLVLSVCVLGVSTVSNVEKMQNLESAVSQITGHGGQESGVPAMSQNTGSSESGSGKEKAAGEGKSGSGEDSGTGNGQSGSGEGSGTGNGQSGGGENSATDNGKTGSGENTGNEQSDGGENTGSGNGQSGSGENAGTGNGQSGNGENAGSGNGQSGSGAGSGSGNGESSADGSSADKPGAQSGDDESGNASGSKSGKKESDGGNGESDKQDSEQVSSDSLDAESLSEAQRYLLQGYYIVKKGDSLVGISKKIYGTPAKARKICKLNGIDDMDKIYAGQRLELP